MAKGKKSKRQARLDDDIKERLQKKEIEKKESRNRKRERKVQENMA